MQCMQLRNQPAAGLSYQYPVYNSLRFTTNLVSDLYAVCVESALGLKSTGHLS